MHVRMITIFSLLISISAYAADIPSSSSSKQEFATQDNNILILSEPTENGVIEHRVNLEDDEVLKFMPYREIIEEQEKKGLPTALCIFTRLQNSKAYSQVYDWLSLEPWYKKHLLEPTANIPIPTDNQSYFLVVRNRKSGYKATFLFKGETPVNNKTKTLNNLLIDTLNEYKKENPQVSDLAATRAACYTSLIEKFTKRHPNLASKFAKFGLEGIPDKPEGILAARRGFFLRARANIYQEAGNIPAALELYRKGISLNDSFSFPALAKLSMNLSNDEIQQSITLFEAKAAAESDPVTLQHIYTNSIPLYEKIGNQEAADAARKKIIDLDNAVKNSFKRERPGSPTQEQNNLQVTPKRARFSTPT